jgi:hypothetical protein
MANEVRQFKPRRASRADAVLGAPERRRAGGDESLEAEPEDVRLELSSFFADAEHHEVVRRRTGRG